METNWRSRTRRSHGKVYLKHLLALKDAWTPTKIWNLLKCEAEKRTRRTNTRAMPYTAVIDVTNVCNLRCPGCPTGAGIVGRKKTLLSTERIEKFLDETDPYLFLAVLYNWGETLLHPQAPEIVKMVRDRRIFTSISSNLNIQDFSKLEAVCEAGLDHLIISADGITEESYGKYRVGGDLELVLENVRKIVQWRKANKRKRPLLEWQILSFTHLASELQQALTLAKKLGVDMFCVKEPTAPDKLKLKLGKSEPHGSRCDLLWHTVVLQPDGGLAPCSRLYHKADDFGHIDDMSVHELRNNERYTQARKFFDRSAAHQLDPDLDHPCLRCPVVHDQDHLQSYLKTNENAFMQENVMGILTSPTEAGVWQIDPVKEKRKEKESAT